MRVSESGSCWPSCSQPVMTWERPTGTRAVIGAVRADRTAKAVKQAPPCRAEATKEEAPARPSRGKRGVVQGIVRRPAWTVWLLPCAGAVDQSLTTRPQGNMYCFMLRIFSPLGLVIGLATISAPLYAQEQPDTAPSPGSARPPLRVSPPGVDVRFDPVTPGLTLLHQTAVTPVVFVKGWNFYRERPTPVYTPLCTGQCDTRLVPGEHRFAIGRPGSDPVIADGPVRISGPVELRAEYVDRKAIRTTGAIVAIAGPLTGLAMILAGTYQGGGNVCDYSGNCFDRGNDNNLTLRATGVVTLVGTLLLGVSAAGAKRRSPHRGGAPHCGAVRST